VRPTREFDHLIWPVSDVTHIWPDLKPGMTIGWWEGPDGPDYLNVVAVHPPDPDDEDWVYIDAVEGRFRRLAGDIFEEITPELADLMGVIVVAESARLAANGGAP
jgi:hypothetical protein